MVIPALVLLAFCTTPGAEATLLDQGYDDMYKLHFDAAHADFHEWEQLHQADPMGPVSDAAAHLFFEFDRLKILRSELYASNASFLNSKAATPDPRVKSAFEADLAQAKRLSEDALRSSAGDQNALLANVLRIALHADYEALIDRHYWESLKEIKEARNQATDLLSKYPECYDAYLAIGVENYLLSLKPAPVRWFLRLDGAETDRETGIEKLRLVAEKGRYLRPYAKVLLAISAIRSDDKSEARRLLADLSHQFPENELFRAELQRLQ